ncbi:MAG: hypothetical protein K0S11_1808 [Gammaproteobacteria bacterium]|jgi:hypothetical protein|nr:hypothetical protein [Gammaproteobacteria bacterium]
MTYRAAHKKTVKNMLLAGFSGPVALSSGLCEAADIALILKRALELIHQQNKNSFFNSSTPKADIETIGLYVFIATVAGFASLTEASVILYHMLKKAGILRKTHIQTQQHEHDHHNHSSVGQIISYALNTVGLALRGGFSVISVKEFMEEFILPKHPELKRPWKNLALWLPGIGLSLIGRIPGSFYVEAEHTHHAFTQELKKRSCNFKTIATGFLYATICLSHALGYFFESKEIADENFTNRAFLWTAYGVGILLSPVVAIQDAIVEGHHIENIKEYWEILRCQPSHLVAVCMATIGTFAHAAPTFIGCLLALTMAGMDPYLALGFAIFQTLLDIATSLPLHFEPYLKLIQHFQDMFGNCCDSIRSTPNEEFRLTIEDVTDEPDSSSSLLLNRY